MHQKTLTLNSMHYCFDSVRRISPLSHNY